jgi:hypothetical protein
LALEKRRFAECDDAVPMVKIGEPREAADEDFAAGRHPDIERFTVDALETRDLVKRDALLGFEGSGTVHPSDIAATV